MSLIVEKFSVSYPAGKGRLVRAVRDVSLHLLPGKTIGLVGESGCGKSSLAKALVGLEPISSGRATCDDLLLDTKNIKKWRKKVQMVFQDPHTSLNPRMRIEEILSEVLDANTSLNKVEKQERLLWLIESVGLSSESLSRYPHQLSGGQRQRIGIARALAVGAQYLILDEVVSALDVSVQAQIVELLLELQKQTQLAYLFVTHDLALLEHFTHEVIVMYLGNIVEAGPVELITKSPQHPYTQSLISAIPTISKGLGAHYKPLIGEVPSPLNPPKGCAFENRCQYAKPCCKDRLPPLISFANQRRIACFLYEE